MVKLMAGLVAIAIASSAIAGETQKNTAKIPSLKSGECTITLLDADGIKPLAGAKLVLQSAKDAKNATTVKANQAGACVMDIADGRYILSVNDKILTLLDASKDGQLAWCRIVVSEQPMLIGGQVAESAGGFTFLGLSGSAGVGAAVGAGLVVVGGVVVAADAIDDDDDDDDDELPPPVSP
jgi:hypothetical protein